MGQCTAPKLAASRMDDRCRNRVIWPGMADHCRAPDTARTRYADRAPMDRSMERFDCARRRRCGTSGKLRKYQFGSGTLLAARPGRVQLARRRGLVELTNPTPPADSDWRFNWWVSTAGLADSGVF